MRLIGLCIAAAAILPTSAMAQAVCPGQRVPLKTPALTATPYAELKLGNVTGPWLIDYGWSNTTISASYWHRPASGTVSLSGLSFPFGPTGARDYPVQTMQIAYQGVGQQRGVLGIDILKDVTVEFHYEDANAPFMIVSKQPCAANLFAANFFRIGQAGFFGTNPANPPGIANIPVAFIQLEQRDSGAAQPERSTRVWAQIDTGYDDTYWPYSVDINEAYLAELRKLGQKPVKVGTVPMGGCGGEGSVRDVYTVPGYKLRITDGTGIPLARWFDVYSLVVKPRNTACGGIGAMDVPAAQLSSSFLRAFGTTIFMPSTGEVWIRTPTNPTATGDLPPS